MTKDPVCGADLVEAEARAKGLTAEHEGRTFFFCSRDCQQTFERFPGTYASIAGGDERSEQPGEDYFTA